MFKKFIIIFFLLFSSLNANNTIVNTTTNIVVPPTIVLGTDSVLLAVNPQGTPPFRYQWYRNNVRILGETNPSCTITKPGLYYVIVSNLGGSVTSGKVRLLNNSIDTTADDIIMRK